MTSLDKQLDQMRSRVDPLLERVDPRLDGHDVLTRIGGGQIAELASWTGWNHAKAHSAFFRECVQTLLAAGPAVALDEVDWREVLSAQNIFGEYGNEIGSALLLAALPQTYATERGSRVLAGSRLESDLTRRIRGTAQFLMLVMLATKALDVRAYESCNPFTMSEDEQCAAIKSAWKPGSGIRWRVCATLRIYHEAIRRRLDVPPADRERPLNQEDLLGALLTFSITVFEVLEQFGITWTGEEQLAYLRTWHLVGSVLGVTGLLDPIAETPFSPPLPAGLPPTVKDAREVLEVIRLRNWTSVSKYPNLRDRLCGTEDGARLVAALLEELADAMPAPLKRLPEIMIRQLAVPVVRDRLGLGGGGVLQAVLDDLPRAPIEASRISAVELPNRARAMWLRQAANTVTRAATVRFIRDGDDGAVFVIPGLMDWMDGWRSAGQQAKATIGTKRSNFTRMLYLS
jgi:hypothetical protein